MVRARALIEVSAEFEDCADAEATAIRHENKRIRQRVIRDGHIKTAARGRFYRQRPRERKEKNRAKKGKNRRGKEEKGKDHVGRAAPGCPSSPARPLASTANACSTQASSGIPVSITVLGKVIASNRAFTSR